MLSKLFILLAVLPCLVLCTHCGKNNNLNSNYNITYNKHKVSYLDSYKFSNEKEELNWHYLYKNKDNLLLNHLIKDNNFHFKNLKNFYLGSKFNNYNLPTNIVIDNNILYAINSKNYLLKISLSNYTITDKIKLKFIKNDNVVGIAYNNDHLYIATNNGKLSSCYNNGEEKWSINLLYPIQSAPIIDNDKLFVIANNSVYSINAFSGELIWEYKGIENGITFNQATIPTIYSNFVIVGLSNGNILFLRKENGQLVWMYSLNIGRSLVSNAIIAPPILVNNGNNVLISSFNSKTYLLNPIKNAEVWHNINIGYINPPAIANNHLFVIDTNNSLVNLDLKDGNSYWSLDLQSLSNKKINFLNWYGPILINNHIMIYNSKGYIYIISPQDGNIVSSYKLNLAWFDKLTNIFAIVNKKIILLGLKTIYIIE